MTFAIVIDEDSDDLLQKIHKALLRIRNMEINSLVFIAPDEEIGVKFSKIVEYWARQIQVEKVRPLLCRG